MQVKQHIHALRSQLLEMSRLSQRAVDYSIKAYDLASPEFCAHVAKRERVFVELHRRIEVRCCNLLAAGLPVCADESFAWAALRVSRALRATYSAAMDIAEKTKVFVESGRVSESPALGRMGRLINRLIRLCTVALFEEDVRHAKTVLRDDGVAQWYDLAVARVRTENCSQNEEQARFELAMTQSYGKIAEQAHEMADALTFWMEGKDCSCVTRKLARYVPGEPLFEQRDKHVEVMPLSRRMSCWSGS